MNFSESNFAVDITDSFEIKVKAIKAHESQFGNLDDSTWIKDIAEAQGKLFGFELTESFVRIDISQLSLIGFYNYTS